MRLPAIGSLNGGEREKKALKALRNNPKLAVLVGHYFEGGAAEDTLAGAVAAHYGEGARWKEWRDPVERALAVIAVDVETI